MLFCAVSSNTWQPQLYVCNVCNETWAVKEKTSYTIQL
jgi:hypothetical protein